MMEITKRNASMWSRIGIRAFYGQSLSGLAASNSNVIAVSADSDALRVGPVLA